MHAAWLAVALPLTGCSGDSGPDVDVAGSWVLVSGRTADGPLALAPGSRVSLTFADGEAGGKAPCNDYGAPYEVAGDTFTLSGDDVELAFRYLPPWPRAEVLSESVLEVRTTHGRPELVVRDAHGTGESVVVYRR